ncbi:MAG: outer membrane lipoprotein-sorting protein, partial [Acidobacteria bacterium Pan2503]|nr:outer membrane lipoprotein-sorting protein [Candidatus Acidoferrum panamensis]
MKTVFFTLAGLTALFAATIPEAPDAAALLKRSDGYRNAWPSFVTKIKISNFEAGKQDEEHMYLVYSRGSERVYVDFQSPQEKGRHLLMLGDDMWIYLPDTSRAVRITPLQRLTGNASNGDV